jgi:solute carrier family 25 thiamine pyrophosphate transporter 19
VPTILKFYLVLTSCVPPFSTPTFHHRKHDPHLMKGQDPGAQRRETSPVVTAAAGGIAGLTSRFIIAPLDVVKIRLQLQIARSPRIGAAVHAARNIVAREGLTALWKGNIPAELLYVSYSMVQFVAYREAHVLLERTNVPPAYRSGLAGASAGMCATLVTYPLDLLRTRFAAQGTTKVSCILHVANEVYQSLRASIVDILRDEGVAGYYRGVLTSLFQIAPYMGILFGTYEPTRHFLTARSPFSPRASDFLAGGIAGVVSKCAVFPLDTVRKRLQVQGPTRGRYVYADIPVYGGGIWAAMRQIVAREGVRGLYRGLGVALLKSGPSAAVTLWVFDGCLHLWEWVHYRPGRGGTWHD